MHSCPAQFDKSDLKWSKELASLIKGGSSFHNFPTLYAKLLKLHDGKIKLRLVLC